MTKKTLLEFKDVTLTLKSGPNEEKKLIDKLNLTIKQGDFITLLGTNGAGKSTLLNLINGTLQPTQGEIFLANQPFKKISTKKKMGLIAQVFQDPKAGTAPRMTVAENLLLALKRGQCRTLRLRKLTAKKEYLTSLCAQLPNKLADNIDNFVANLSGGQRQTLSFLMATVKKPALLLLDEHTAALDPKTSAQLMQLTNQTITNQNLTCLMITHQLSDALKYGNRTIILKDGKIVLDVCGKQKEALTIPEILQYFAD